MSQFDGRYDYTKPWNNQGPIVPGGNSRWTYAGPWSSNEERLTQQALAVALIPGAELQEMVRPNLPQIQLFPARFGYGERTQPEIDDVVSIDRNYVEPRVSWYSGGVGSYSGSSRNDLGAN
jgi:hypothetical protein